MNERNTTRRWPPARERLCARLAEAIDVIRKCWDADDYFTHRGQYFESFFYLYVKPEPPVPLLCAANGARTARLAGRVADGFCCVGVTPEDFAGLGCCQHSKQEPQMLDADFDGMDKLVWIPTTFHPDADKARLASKLEAGVLMPGVLERVRDPREMEALGETVDDEVILSCAPASQAVQTRSSRSFNATPTLGLLVLFGGTSSPDPSLIPAVAREVIVALGNR